MAEPKLRPAFPGEMGPIFDLRTHTSVMVGPKELNPRDHAVHGERWTIVVDDERNCVWIGWEGEWWSRVEWGQVSYIRYCRKDGLRPGEPEDVMKARLRRERGEAA